MIDPDREGDDLDSLRVVLGATVVVGIFFSIIAEPFFLAGGSAVLDLVLVILLGIATWFYFNPPSVIHAGWLSRAQPAASSPFVGRFLGWLDSPLTGTCLLSAWPPMLGVFIGRELSTRWSTPHGPMILYVIALGVFTVVAAGRIGSDEDEEEGAPQPLVMIVARAVLWLGSIGSFLWLAASFGPYLLPY